MRTASLTSSRSLANLLIANYFSSSIIFLYRLTVSSFSLTYFVNSILTTLISFFYFSALAFSSSIVFSRLFISASYSLKSTLIFSMSSLLSWSSFDESSPEDYSDDGFYPSFFPSSLFSFVYSLALPFSVLSASVLSYFEFKSALSSCLASSGSFSFSLEACLSFVSLEASFFASSSFFFYFASYSAW